MTIVLDSNVLIAALIRDSSLRAILFSTRRFFCMPTYALQEIQKHEPEILEKSRLTEGQMHDILRGLLSRIRLVSDEILLPYVAEAQEIVKDIDVDDALFIACCLAFPGSVLWSDDKALKKQQRIPVLNTSEIRVRLNRFL